MYLAASLFGKVSKAFQLKAIPGSEEICEERSVREDHHWHAFGELGGCYH